MKFLKKLQSYNWESLNFLSIEVITVIMFVICFLPLLFYFFEKREKTIMEKRIDILSIKIKTYELFLKITHNKEDFDLVKERLSDSLRMKDSTNTEDFAKLLLLPRTELSEKLKNFDLDNKFALAVEMNDDLKFNIDKVEEKKE